MAHDGSQCRTRHTPAEGEDEERVKEHIRRQPEDGDTEGRTAIANSIVDTREGGGEVDAGEAYEREVEVAQALGPYARDERIEVQEIACKEQVDRQHPHAQEEAHADVLRGIVLGFVTMTSTDTLRDRHFAPDLIDECEGGSYPEEDGGRTHRC